MKAYLPDFTIGKLLLDSAMDAYPLYHYCRKKGIIPFIDLKKTNNRNYKYKDIFTIDPDVFLTVKRAYVCIMTESNIKRTAVNFAALYRTVHTYLSDDPRIFNIPPRDSKEWKKEFGRRTSVERSNKREKNDL